MDRMREGIRELGEGKPARLPQRPRAREPLVGCDLEKLRKLYGGFFGSHGLQVSDVDDCLSICEIRFRVAMRQKTIRNPKAFYRAIAANVVHEFHRGIRRAPVPLPPQGVCEDRRRPWASPTPHLEGFSEEVKEALDALTLRERDVFVLACSDGVRASEVAVALGTSVGAVRKAKCLAVKKLRRRLLAAAGESRESR